MVATKVVIGETGYTRRHNSINTTYKQVIHFVAQVVRVTFSWTSVLLNETVSYYHLMKGHLRY